MLISNYGSSRKDFHELHIDKNCPWSVGLYSYIQPQKGHQNVQNSNGNKVLYILSSTSFLWAIRIKNTENCCRFVFDKNIDSFLCPFPLKSLRGKSRARIETKMMICLVKTTFLCGRAPGLPNSRDQHYDQLKQKRF